jgi:dienelactone hydrolase
MATLRHLLIPLTAVLGAMSAVPAGAAVKTESVRYNIGSEVYQGYLAYDDASTAKRPGVLVAPEWWGLNDYTKHRAEQLADLGYVAFVMDPYGGGKNTNDPKEAGTWAGALKADPKELRARASAALEVLQKDPRVEPGKLAAIGYCFGGTTALELARSGAELAGIVSFHGGLATKSPAAPGAIKAKVLICHGGDDAFESPQEIAAFQEEMRTAGVDWQMDIYGGAVHAFTNPEADKHGIKGIAYNEKADKRSWEAMKGFLAEAFK